ncbi:undecaprenyl-diphosphatase [Comamonas odontotermitis]|uniref:Undecaprenyl-diphosphatase n=1 Tax=Comamonas odontotermitis TaxID=379895 RepID=A0ABR6RFL8_9BURK|nr:phosphatase PAP2 family protein [Comamonas odontotermitis]MBB6577951.1 undecaprenyl-diphosphatase [Comamonas odontotermitis]
MEEINLQWFAWMAGGVTPTAWALVIARWLGTYGVVLAAAVLVWIWWKHPANRLYVMGSLICCAAAVLLAHRLALWIGHPRPFVMGLSPAYIDHAARGSLPSAHASALFTIGFCLLGLRQLRLAGAAILAAGVAVSWGRVYCGVHFPLDIAAGAALGLMVAGIYGWTWRHASPATLEQGAKERQNHAPFGQHSVPAAAE